MATDVTKLKDLKRPQGLPFRISKIGHVVLNCSDLARSVEFYTQVLGFSVSDVYPEAMVPGGMVFMRFNSDHHGVALVGSMKGPSPRRRADRGGVSRSRRPSPGDFLGLGPSRQRRPCAPRLGMEMGAHAGRRDRRSRARARHELRQIPAEGLRR
jgi:catechol 2,3-dioxygenase-like lactoylglutathione lyase family enzyme